MPGPGDSSVTKVGGHATDFDVELGQVVTPFSGMSKQTVQS